MTKVHCSVEERYVNPLFEVFDGGDFVLSSYHDIESDSTEMRVYLEDASCAADAARRLSDALAVVGCAAKVETAEVPDEDWKLSYRRHFKTEKVARRLVTVPTWELDEFRASDDADLRGRIPLVLDPGLAFGTGKHETTRACLEYIDEIVGGFECLGSECLSREREKGTQSTQTLKPSNTQTLSFLDMGCGSGILSIAAAKLGCDPVCGFDIDEDAVNASRENAELNGVKVDYRLFALGKGAVSLDDTIEASKGIYPDLALQGRNVGAQSAPFAPADVVVANILGPLLIAFADEIVSYAKDALVVSGILTELYPEVLAAFSARGFEEVSRKTIGEWTTGLLRRK
jgi:ribosomal protein L11 methyltransferase